jgi:inhibitor of KinA sporulation pathway (predicted exonuclease)
MQLLVIDLESTCWEKAPPPGEVSDIIEIGVTELDLPSLKLVHSESIIAKPERSRVSEFCTKLNGHTAESVSKGHHIALAFDCLRAKFDSNHRPWASWGAYDRKMIEKTAVDFKLTSPVTRRHLNAKTLFACVLGLDREVGMAEALKILAMPLEGRHHSGVDDSRNIARILQVILGAAREEALGRAVEWLKEPGKLGKPGIPPSGDTGLEEGWEMLIYSDSGKR